ncbi:hypothetical protein PanWU01x14_145740 [Parasponia andersonii]|uniref:Uncharacterized protein n=1 Tax=Parasponia andersonii TaxID=3476 RepID=A0A2P5CKA4_PARAD|nr:hypothetical protein PanWU01x14_145740 [Parasponia andersonii]
MKGGFFLDVVVSKSSAVLKLLAGKDQPLLVWGDTFLVLNLSFDIVNGVGAFDFKGDGFPSEGLHKNLHTTTETEDQVKGGFFLDVVVGKSPAILELLAGKDQPLLVRWDTFLVLDFGLDIVNCVGAFDLQGDGFPSKGLNEDLHTTTQTEHQVKSGLFLDVVISKGATILELFTGEDQPLLVWGNTLLVLNLGLDIIDGVRAFHLKGDSLSCESFHEDLHLF